MSIAVIADRQAAVEAADSAFSSLYWRETEPDDLKVFSEHPWARALVRPWREIDDPYGQEYANTYDMACFTVVFRVGCRVRLFYPFIDEREGLAWECVIRHGLSYLAGCPELGFGADLSAKRLAA